MVRIFGGYEQLVERRGRRQQRNFHFTLCYAVWKQSARNVGKQSAQSLCIMLSDGDGASSLGSLSQRRGVDEVSVGRGYSTPSPRRVRPSQTDSSRAGGAASVVVEHA
jgi:hypothetical protein